MGGCNSLAALNENNSSADTITVTTTVRTSHYRVFASIRNMFATSPEGVPRTEGLGRVACSRVLRLTALNTRILGGHSIRVTGGCGIRVRMLSDLGHMPNAVIGRITGVRGVLMENIAGSASITEVSIAGVSGAPNVTFGLFSGLTRGNVGISVVLRSMNHSNAGSVAFAITGSGTISTVTTIRRAFSVSSGGVAYTAGITGVSIINTNVRSRPKATSGVFRTLCRRSVGVSVVSADRVGVSILVSTRSTSETITTIRGTFCPRLGWVPCGWGGGLYV